MYGRYITPPRLDIVFFQAEDGIRDLTVTGVQACALPIWTGDEAAFAEIDRRYRNQITNYVYRMTNDYDRSEERRVGKECRSRWSPDHLKKKAQASARPSRFDFDTTDVQTGPTEGGYTATP